MAKAVTRPTLETMGIVAAFLIIVGVPFVAAVALDSIQMPRLAKAAVIGSLPAALAVWLYRPLDVTTELGLPFIAFVVVLGWFFGFAIGPLVRAMLRGAIRLAKPVGDR
jgi:hypothetical protein